MRRTFLSPALAALLVAATPVVAQSPVKYEGRDALQLSNEKIEVVITHTGGAIASMILREDSKRINPIWNPDRLLREAGAPQRQGPGIGHFLCVDGFGPITKEEQAAGYANHGEAHRLPMENVKATARSLSYTSRLPVVQEQLARRFSIEPNEQVMLIETDLESELSFDRPLLWAEHATIGAPFLGLGTVVVDQSASQCQTKPYDGARGRGMRTLPGGKDFLWPNAPGDAGPVNLRVSPAQDGRMDHIGCLMDPKREHEFITALNTSENLMIGYLFRRTDYPWVQHWMSYPTNKAYSWGLEFGMQPYDMTKRDLFALSPMFGTPTMRWLPAKSKLSTRFLMFVTKVPAGFRKVDDVRLEGGQIVIEDRGAGKRVTLVSSRGL
jgi:hypothetical protein